MTVIACRVHKYGYDISSDSITTRGYSQTKGQTTNNPKLFEVKGIVVGGTGSCEENGLMRLFLDTHCPAEPTEKSLLEFLSEFSDWKYKKTSNSEIENAYLIGIENCVFVIEGWNIEKVKDYMAIGAGRDFALAALHLGNTATTAVETAIELSIYCESPVISINKYHVTEKE